MSGVWYFLLAAMLTTYAVLDGFDFGAGILHLAVAKTDDERQTVLAAIGPVWDGNEVWLIAGGGVFVFAFPRAYAAAFSGLYLPLMLVLWLLVFRGIAIEFRSKVPHPLWRAAFDAMFMLASAVMAVVLGVALGNLLRGVPLEESGYFHEDLWTDFGARGAALGAIDWYTALVGVFAFLALAAHGASFLAWKTEGAVHDRSVALGRRLVPAMLAAAVVVTAVTPIAEPAHFHTFVARPWVWPLPVLGAAAGAIAWRSLARGLDARAFLATSLFIVAMLLATACTLFPAILRSTVSPELSLDAYNASSARATLALGLWIWAPAIALAIGYFTYLYRSTRGKVRLDDAHY